jgi:hypothetical protein
VLDLQAIKARAASRLARMPTAAAPANPANWLMPRAPISHLATLAGQAPDESAECNRILAAVAWTAADIAAFLNRRARLLRWGWTDAEAEALAERLVTRDRSDDDRVSCTDCAHFRPWRCANHRRAGLHGSEVGRDLAGLLQRCPGFEVTSRV